MPVIWGSVMSSKICLHKKIAHRTIQNFLCPRYIKKNTAAKAFMNTIYITFVRVEVRVEVIADETGRQTDKEVGMV